MTSHYYNLIGAVSAFLDANAESQNSYSKDQTKPLETATGDLKQLVKNDLKQAFDEVATALQNLKEAAAKTYKNDPNNAQLLGTPTYSNDVWSFPDDCIGKAIYFAIKALNDTGGKPLAAVVGPDIAGKLFEIQRLMRPQAPPGGDDPSTRPCWPSCLVSSSSSS